ncbi:DUF2083 domain-containing protein [Xylophilus rhododendri]|uniref:DUF2083 domain-containing protein n=1 Tax=Xylophilus rhododendri TaxID=2697032 RepID=A0A857JBW4_9BURK|nr:short-chain fatty acyl-CoA regulator family protein [Xylophilus rhododendri]QHJ00443.1 DUF2083 domain-containing protein [Xylophilus rhododendri]
MRKMFMGVRLRRLRAERGMTQAALAQALDLSPSYLNQLEQNRRPLTVAVLLKIQHALGVDIQEFSEDESSRLVAGLREALADPAESITLPELQELAAQMPALARAVLVLHRRNAALADQVEALTLRLGDDRTELGVPQATAFEVVRDFFFAHGNYFDVLDRAAEAMAAKLGTAVGPDWLARRLQREHGVSIRLETMTDSKRRFDSAARVLHLPAGLQPAQLAFQLATQLALAEQEEAITRLTDAPTLQQDEAARKLARIGLANYFAGALLLPYGEFLRAAEELRFDIDLLAQRYGVGFETVCHRLSTLQRPGTPGVPFFFVRVDRAGNISKRQSATHFHFSRTGGTCPLWNVYEAFGQPGRIMPQLARMPDGRVYLWIARTVTGHSTGFGSPQKTFSIGLGCDVRHAGRMVYAKGLDLQDPDVATPIGMGCKICERESCAQRAFPFVGRPLAVDENQSRFAPYGFSP